MGDPVGTATVVFGLWLARVVTAALRAPTGSTRW